MVLLWGMMLLGCYLSWQSLESLVPEGGQLRAAVARQHGCRRAQWELTEAAQREQHLPGVGF